MTCPHLFKKKTWTKQQKVEEITTQDYNKYRSKCGEIKGARECIDTIF